MKRRIAALILACMLILIGSVALAGTYEHIDPSIVIGADELSWITVVGSNDTPSESTNALLDVVFLDNTGEKLPLPEDSAQWAAWLDDICVNKTDGKGDLAFGNYSNEDFLRVAYDLDGWGYYDHTRHCYSDYTRVMISGLTGYVYWSTGTDAVQHGAKVVYDDDTGVFTVSEFNLLTIDGSFDDVLAACYFGYLRYTCNYKVDTESGNLLLRAEPSSEGKVLEKIGKGKEIGVIYDYIYTADNGYDYVPVRYDTEDRSVYGWVAYDYLGMNDRVDAVTWVGRKADELEYPSAEEFMAREGKDPVTVTVTVGNEPENGTAYTEGEWIDFIIDVTNNTFTDISPAYFDDIDDVVIFIPARRTKTVEVSYQVTAQDAAAGALTRVYVMKWTDADGEQRMASSIPLVALTRQ